MENADLVIIKKPSHQEQVLSFGKFSTICLENNFFSIEKQNQFLENAMDQVI